MKNLKSLMERRAELMNTMTNLTNTADTETRAMTAEEIASFDAAEAEIKNIDETIAREQRAQNIQPAEVKEERAEDHAAFLSILKNGTDMEVRSGEQNITYGANGAIIPTTIAQKIITKVSELSPIFARCTRFAVPGTLKVPVWGNANNTHNIDVDYQAEFTDITADAGKFISVDLTGYLAGALTLIGRSVINNSQIDVEGFVIDEMARRIAAFLDKELLTGSGSSAATGAIATSNTLLAGSTSAISADKLIELQMKVPTVYQQNACWIMNPATLLGIRQLKNGQGIYLLQNDLSQEFPYRLLGKPVYLSDNMPTIDSAAKTVLYGDPAGLACNMRENIEIQVLREKYATMHAVGVVSWFEFDSNVIDAQKLAALVMSVS